MSLDLNSFVSTPLEPLRVTVSADTPPFYGYVSAPQTQTTSIAFTSGGTFTPMPSTRGNVGFIPPALTTEDYRWPYAPLPEPDPSINVENFNLYLQGLTDGNNREWLGSKAEIKYLEENARSLGQRKFLVWVEGYESSVRTFDNEKWSNIVSDIRRGVKAARDDSMYRYHVTAEHVHGGIQGTTQGIDAYMRALNGAGAIY